MASVLMCKSQAAEEQIYFAFQKSLPDKQDVFPGSHESSYASTPPTYYVDQNGQYYALQPAPAVTGKPSEILLAVGDIVVKPSDFPAETSSLSVRAPESGPSENILSNGEAPSFQTVALVQSEIADGVQYVLVMEQNKQEIAVDGDDPNVYDFREFDESGMVPEDASDSEEVEERFDGVFQAVGKKLTPPPAAGVTTHICLHCSYKTSKRYLLARHMKSHSEDRPHRCSICERGFKTLASLHNHANTHTGTKPHPCKYCNIPFTTSGELIRHIRYRHTLERPHKCSDCTYSSVELSKLKRHMRAHTGERPYQCPHCTYASPDTFKLKRHIRTHTGEKPYECDICQARFTQSNSMKAHRMIHTGQKPIFQCSLCPATCGRKTDLRIHIQKLHTSDNIFTCRRCGKNFPDRYSYKTHTKTHEGEKCFQCNLCPYSTSTQRHLESHMLIHSDQKPYKCDCCDQTFRQKQLLKRHMNLYHSPNYVPPKPREKTQECGECGRVFRHKGNLIRHMALHDPELQVYVSQNQEALRVGRSRRIIPQGVPSKSIETGGARFTTIHGADGQQYVVVQVIESSGNRGVQQLNGALNVLAVDSRNRYLLGMEEEEDETRIKLRQFGDDLIPDLNNDLIDNEDLPPPTQDLNTALRREVSIAMRKHLMATHEDAENCFGFDDEESME